jgi:hypothetical protein
MLTKDNYREYPAINYSLLSKLSRDPSAVLAEEKDFSDGIMFGDALDILLTQGQEEFDKKYIVAKVERPTGQMGDFVDAYYKSHDIKEAYNIVGFKRDSLEKVYERFLKEGSEYLQFLCESEGKKVISAEMLMKVNQAINTLKTHQFTKEYFDYSIGTSNMIWFEKYHQLPLSFNVKDKECKGLLDMVFVNHGNKIVIPVDIKSMGDYVNSFPTNFQKWNYHIQAAFYTEALKQKYPDYEIKPFRFIVISSLQLNKPLIYTCTDNDLLVGKLGGVNTYTNRKVKGYEQLIDDYIWHSENNLWDYPREVYERNGEVDLDVFKYEFKKKTYDGEEYKEE